VNKSKRRANVTVSGLVLLGGLLALVLAMGCGSPNWQNQYTEEPDYSAGGSAGSGGGGDDSSDGGADGSDACDPGTPNCNSTDFLAPPWRPTGGPTPTPTDPQGNPDPVPWHIHPIILPRSQ
jgi:hypothetical protein